MRFRALAMDGDGTLFRGDGPVRGTVEALRRLRDAGFKLFLVSGETEADMQELPHVELFDCIAIENGGLLYWPQTGKSKPLGPKLPRSLVMELNAGQVMVASVLEFETQLHSAIRSLQLDFRILHNRRNVMALPAGVDKAVGLAAVAGTCGLTPFEVIAVGDAENDVSLLDRAGYGVAVGNAVPMLKQRADLVLRHGPGRGVVELIDRILADNLPRPD